MRCLAMFCLVLDLALAMAFALAFQLVLAPIPFAEATEYVCKTTLQSMSGQYKGCLVQLNEKRRFLSEDKMSKLECEIFCASAEQVTQVEYRSSAEFDFSNCSTKIRLDKKGLYAGCDLSRAKGRSESFDRNQIAEDVCKAFCTNFRVVQKPSLRPGITETIKSSPKGVGSGPSAQ